MADFNYEIELDVRFRDLDPMQHVNNAVYASYLEQARVQYVQDVVEKPLMETGAVVANLNIEFEQPIEYGETVTVAVRAGEMGRTSVPLHYEIRTESGRAATAETLLVAYDRDAGKPRPIPDEWREAITEHEGR